MTLPPQHLIQYTLISDKYFNSSLSNFISLNRRAEYIGGAAGFRLNSTRYSTSPWRRHLWGCHEDVLNDNSVYAITDVTALPYSNNDLDV